MQTPQGCNCRLHPQSQRQRTSPLSGDKGSVHPNPYHSVYRLSDTIFLSLSSPLSHAWYSLLEFVLATASAKAVMLGYSMLTTTAPASGPANFACHTRVWA